MNPPRQEFQFNLVKCPPWKDYALLDSGNGQKLERFGLHCFVRPEPQAFWMPALGRKDWEEAFHFVSNSKGDGGTWKGPGPLPNRWQMSYRDVSLWAEPTPFRHMGLFPELSAQWDWAGDLVRGAGRPINVLNLFGYTGLFSLSLAAAGARVTHIDASHKAITWGRANQELSGFMDKPIRWIPEDCLKYVRREVKRGAKYDAIIIDAPKFGHGTGGEIWKIEESLPVLLEEARRVLSDTPLFTLVVTYVIRATSTALFYTLSDLMEGFNGTVSAGEMALVEQSADRMLSTAFFARWQESKAGR